MMKIATASFVVLASLASNYADASPNPSVNWSTPGAGCQLETGSSSIADVRGNGEVAFQTGQTGTIKLVCPVNGIFVSDTSDNPTSLDLVFYDQDGTSDGCYVQASLKRGTRGTAETVATIVAYLGNLDTSLASSSPFRNFHHSPISHTFNFDNNSYWVEVTLFRSVTTCDAALEVVTLSAPVS